MEQYLNGLYQEYGTPQEKYLDEVHQEFGNVFVIVFSLFFN